MHINVHLEDVELRRGERAVYLDVSGRVEVEGGTAVAGSEERVTIACPNCDAARELTPDEQETVLAALREEAEAMAAAVAAASREP